MSADTQGFEDVEDLQNFGSAFPCPLTVGIGAADIQKLKSAGICTVYVPSSPFPHTSGPFPYPLLQI